MNDVLLSVRGLTVHFPVRRSMLTNRPKEMVRAVDDVAEVLLLGLRHRAGQAVKLFRGPQGFGKNRQRPTPKLFKLESTTAACGAFGSNCVACRGSAATCQQFGQCVCTPDCQGKVCGDDGCGGSCGPCLEKYDLRCLEGRCTCTGADGLSATWTPMT